MDDSPTAFVSELKHAILKKRVGQIALAIVLGEEILRFIGALTWNLFIPVIGRILEGHTESVLFEGPTRRPIPWENLAGSILELVFTIIVVFYLNRWIQKRPTAVNPESTETDASSAEANVNDAASDGPSSAQVLYNLVGEQIADDR